MPGLAGPSRLLPAVRWKTQRNVKLVMLFIVFRLELRKESFSFFWVIFAQPLSSFAYCPEKDKKASLCVAPFKG